MFEVLEKRGGWELASLAFVSVIRSFLRLVVCVCLGQGVYAIEKDESMNQ